MELFTTIRNRAAIVRFLEECTGLLADYAGAPTFNYMVGEYTVLRNGHIRVADDKADAGLIGKLKESGLVTDGNTGAGRGIEAGISDDVSARVNLIYMISSKSVLINKAIEESNAFFVSSTLIRTLKKENPANLSELQTVLMQYGGKKVLRGIVFSSTKVLFTGFPENRAENELAAYRDFAAGMVKASEKAAWVKADPVKTANERYTFRSWMNSIGMGGKEHADTRRILLQRLSGNTAFRTEEQREKALSVRRKKKEQEKALSLDRKSKEVEKHEPATEPDFVVLGSCDRHSPHGAA